MKNDTAYVILTWNDPKNTFDCIKSILNGDYKKYDIILVDNYSSELNFQKLINSLKKLNFNLFGLNFRFQKTNNFKNNIYIYRINKKANITYARNFGVTKAYNIGIKIALNKRYKYFVKQDCDFIISKFFLSSCLRLLRGNIDYAAVSPKIYYIRQDRKTRLIWWDGLKFNSNYFRFHRTGKGNRKKKDTGQFYGISETDSVCGACTVFRTSYFKKVGQLDQDFFFGPEDMEVSKRLSKYGKLIVNKNTYNYHRVSQSIFVSGMESRAYFETIGWLLIVKKICNFIDRFICYIYFSLRFVFHLYNYLISKKDHQRRIGFIRGFLDFFIYKKYKNNK